MRLSFKSALVAATILAVGGCAQLNLGSSAFTAEGDIAAAKVKSTGSKFDEFLRTEYLALAQDEWNEGDYRDAGFFGGKAAEAQRGETPSLSGIGRWLLPNQTAVDYFKKGYEAVNLLIARGGESAAVARAQAMFECWAQEQEENHQPEDIARCKAEFEKALAQATEEMKPKPKPAAAAPAPKPAAEPAARDYLVFFDFDRTNIRADSAAILKTVADAVAKLKATVVTLVGHADRAGPTGYNQRLSERRADAVKAELAKNGVAVQVMKTSGKGETDPRVPTPDGVREQENRRVEINLK